MSKDDKRTIQDLIEGATVPRMQGICEAGTRLRAGAVIPPMQTLDVSVNQPVPGPSEGLGAPIPAMQTIQPIQQQGGGQGQDGGSNPSAK